LSGGKSLEGAIFIIYLHKGVAKRGESLCKKGRQFPLWREKESGGVAVFLVSFIHRVCVRGGVFGHSSIFSPFCMR